MLAPKRDAQVDSLSRGMKQRLCLARALVHDPKVLLLDEPASGLDPRARTEMREPVSVLQEMGKTIVLSSHILPELAEMCSSYGVIHDGRMFASGPAEAILGGVGPQRARGSGRRRPRGSGKNGSRDTRRAECAEGRCNTLDIEYAGAGSEGGGTDAASLLRALVTAGLPVTDFRTDEGGLEQLFLQLTAPPKATPVTASAPAEQVR